MYRSSIVTLKSQKSRPGKRWHGHLEAGKQDVKYQIDDQSKKEGKRKNKKQIKLNFNKVWNFLKQLDTLISPGIHEMK